MIEPQETTLLFEPTNQLVDALICPLTDAPIDARMQPNWWLDPDLKERFDRVPIDRYWDWHEMTIDFEGMVLASEKVAVMTGDGEIQGGMLISKDPVPSVLQMDQTALFIELLFTAPRNREKLRRDGSRFFVGVGKILLAWGAWFSRECGHQGRIRLDGSPDFIGWYRDRGLQVLGLESVAFEGVEYTPMELAEHAAQELINAAGMPTQSGA